MQPIYASITSCLFWVITCCSLLAQTPKDTLPFRCGAPAVTPAQAKAIQQQAVLAFKRQMNARKAAAGTITYVPIRPHIVRRSDGTGGFTLAALNQRMAFTNSHYLLNGSGIQFYFAGNTPDYINNDQYYDAFPYTGGPAVDGRDATNAMNQYYVINLDGLFVNGIAYFPYDNIVSTRSFIVIGDGSQPILGGHIVMPHELGHNFNLLHTHGPANDSPTDELVTRGDGANCSYAGDQLCDTPADPFYVPGGNNTIADANGCPQYDPNNTARDANGNPYMPMLTNIMSYWFSRCGFDFTPGQHERIQQALALRQTHTAYSLNAPATNVSPPTGLFAYVNGTSVTLTWQDNANNEMGYFIERSNSPTAGFAAIDGVAPDVTTFTDHTTRPMTQYYYRIRPSNTTTGSLSSVAYISTCLVSMSTIKAGLWNDPTVWSCNRVPLDGDVVSIRHQVTIPANYKATAQRVDFDSGTAIIYETNAQLKIGF